MRISNGFFLFNLIFWFSMCMSCASYGAGGVYSKNNQSAMGGYVFADSKYTEATISYAANMSGNGAKSLGAGFSVKYPFALWQIMLFPLANIEYQRIFGGTETLRNLGWLRFGVGVDYSINNTFYVRGEGIYAPNMFSSLPKTDAFRLNPASSFTIRLGVGWRPGTAKSSKKEDRSTDIYREQPDQDIYNQPQTDQTQTSQPQTDADANADDKGGKNNANPERSIGLPDRDYYP